MVAITGASQGIGEAVALAFARGLRGVRLALIARNARNLARVARACVRAGARAEEFICDVTDAAAVETMARAVGKTFGPVDVLVNNAGRFAGAPFLELSVEDFDAQVAVNLRSLFLVSRAFIPAMVRRGRGDVFNLSSIAGMEAYPNGAAYCAAKFGVTGLTKVMRAELKPLGVRVCCVHPGGTWTPSWQKSGVKPERLMPADDIAQAILDIYRLGRNTVVETVVLRPQLGDV